MEVRSYNMELAFANLQFKRLFSNIEIERESSRIGALIRIPVTCVFDLRSRILKNWENAEKRANMKVPMIAITRTGYSRSSDRVNNLNNEVKYEISTNNRRYDLLTPVPVDISYEVSIIAKYPSDIDLIASNFMVFFNNDVFVQSMHPKYEGLYMNNQVVMEDSVSEEHSGEIDSSTDDLVTSTFTFTFKTYLFAGNTKAKRRILYRDAITGLSIDEELCADIIYKYNKDPSSITSIITSDIYEGFTPIIAQLSIGFYPTPFLSDHVAYMTEVDTQYTKDEELRYNYYSSSDYDPFELSVDEEGLSVRVPMKEWYENARTYNTIEPYVDYMNVLKWSIV